MTSHRREDRLKTALQAVSGYDYIIIDCPPSLSTLTINALSAADYLLITMVTEFLALMGVGLLLQTLTSIQQEINPQLKIMGILPARYNSRLVNAREVIARVKEELGGEVHIFGVTIPESVKFREAAGVGKTIYDYDPHNPGAHAYQELAKEVLNYGRQ